MAEVQPVRKEQCVKSVAKSTEKPIRIIILTEQSGNQTKAVIGMNAPAGQKKRKQPIPLHGLLIKKQRQV